MLHNGAFYILTNHQCLARLVIEDCCWMAQMVNCILWGTSEWRLSWLSWKPDCVSCRQDEPLLTYPNVELPYLIKESKHMSGQFWRLTDEIILCSFQYNSFIWVAITPKLFHLSLTKVLYHNITFHSCCCWHNNTGFYWFSRRHCRSTTRSSWWIAICQRWITGRAWRGTSWCNSSKEAAMFRHRVGYAEEACWSFKVRLNCCITTGLIDWFLNERLVVLNEWLKLDFKWETCTKRMTVEDRPKSSTLQGLNAWSLRGCMHMSIEKWRRSDHKFLKNELCLNNGPVPYAPW